jgi:hypothetical protein
MGLFLSCFQGGHLVEGILITFSMRHDPEIVQTARADTFDSSDEEQISVILFWNFRQSQEIRPLLDFRGSSDWLAPPSFPNKPTVSEDRRRACALH